MNNGVLPGCLERLDYGTCCVEALPLFFQMLALHVKRFGLNQNIHIQTTIPRGLAASARVDHQHGVDLKPRAEKFRDGISGGLMFGSWIDSLRWISSPR